MKFVELTDASSGEPLYINIDYIVTIGSIQNPMLAGRTYIDTLYRNECKYYAVRENSKDVINRINTLTTVSVGV